MPISGLALASPGKSSGLTFTTSAALALRSAREYWLMPLVTTRPGSEVAATTWPPGHMQKLYAARPLAQWCTSL